jgi:hypothetical protein
MDHLKGLWQHHLSRVGLLVTLLSMMLGMVAISPSSASIAQAWESGGCHLNSAGGNIKHVIYVQFDNVHFTRDNPNVPSDLEQMPHLLDFITDNGTLLDNHHTPLIAHTANDILTSLTGVYPDRQGQAVANSFRYFNPDGTSNPAVSFAYWTDPIYDPTTTTPTDTSFNMIAANGENAPAPWVPYTRAGCNVGAVATANMELENIATDIPTVFGANSPEANEVKSNPNQASADFIGLAVHCAQGSALCSAANNGKPDLLPDEPGGYSGYNALYGNKYVAPQISPGGPVKDLFGNVIKDPSTGDIGFPGFDGISAAQSLAYVADMQEHGVPVTYAYIADAHDNHGPTGPATFGPGEAGYVAQLKAYDQAFALFFQRLANDGINKSNTLFVFTADEGDHFVGGPPSPSNCDGVTIPCTYSKVGEVDGNLSGLLATEQGITTPFKVHADSAPAIYITGNPARTSSTSRALEQALGKLTAQNVITGNTDRLTNYLADPVELNLLHMITADPARTPSLIMFANPDYFLFTAGTSCGTSCTSLDTGFAWNHGDVAPDINTTWLGLVGPGVQHLGVTGDVWSDHTDIRPTMMVLLGLKDDYQHEGRALFEVLDDWAVPASLRDNRDVLTDLAQAFKQINAPVGALGLATLRISTKALESSSPGDSTYTRLEEKLTGITAQRNEIAGKMLDLLEDAEFNNQPINVGQANRLIAQANALLDQVDAM